MINKKTYASALIFSLFAILVVFTSCSTKKNTFVRRVYHNLTAHYNVYWNGMDNMRSGVKDFQATVKDNYSTILPVYNFGDKASATKVSQFADIAIKKSSKAIQKHSMYFNRKEYNRWIDDSYMLIGKAYFYKQDYPMARRTFEFVIKTYNENEIKFEAMLWQSLANMQLRDYSRAEPMLDMVQNMIKQGKAPEKYEEMLVLCYANFFILQKNYPAATEYLNRALELNPPRTMKTRVIFILAQLDQLNGDLPAASKKYTAVIKRNASFDMEFNAKINLAECYDVSGGNREYIVKKLKKMLKDDKNKEYLDQVYYALGRISLREKDTVAALEYLTKSVTASVQNNYQKAISALEAADIYFARKKYKPAQAYYDSAMLFLPKEHRNYKEISEKTATLNELVKNLQIVQREDSLQKLAGMSNEERTKVIDGIIAKIRAEEIKKQQEEQERQENLNLALQNNPGGMGKGMGAPPGSGGNVGAWYFYNPSSMANGFSNFARKWGRRKLEDTWFLTNKAVVMNTEEQTGEPDELAAAGDTTKGGASAVKTTDMKDRKYYLQDIPNTPEKITASNNDMIQAYYNLGFIFSDELKDYPNSISSFETLNERFPENKYQVASLYQLYQVYTILENQPRADEYRNLILTQYPETDFAKLLVNPDYYKEIQKKKKEVNILYEDTYRAFENQQYYMVINNAGIAASKYAADTAMMPRFEYLRGLSLGKIEVVDSLITAMQAIIKKYPSSEIKPLAQNVLDFVSKPGKGSSASLPDSTGNATPALPELKIYTLEPDAIHFYVVILDNNVVDVNAIKVKLSDFNTKYYDLLNLQVSSLLLDGSLEMVTVNNFENSTKAMEYFVSVHENRYVFTKIENTGSFSDFAISAGNYPVFYRSKNVEQYLLFFRKNYPQNK